MNKILTIDIGASKIMSQTIDEEGNFGSEMFTSIAGLDIDNQKLVEILKSQIKQGLEEKDVLAISVGAPGVIDTEKKIIERLPNIKNVNNLNVAQELFDVKLPVFLLNDADAGGLGEWWLGAGRGYNNFIYLTLSTGVGSTIIKDGKIQNNSELGHAPLSIKDENHQCNCGKKNCAESFLGTNGLARIYSKEFNINDNLSEEEKHEISPRMKDGVRARDEKWIAVQNKYAEYLALFLENIISTHQPKLIILGGGIAFENKPLLEAVETKLNKDTEIKLAQYENSVNLGLAKYALDQLKKKVS